MGNHGLYRGGIDTPSNRSSIEKMGKKKMAVHRRVVIAVVLFSLCGMLGLYLKGREGEYRMPVLPKRLPEKETGWEYTTFHTVLPKDVRGGDVILRAYRRPGGPIISLMALFSPKGNYHPPSLCYRGRGLVLSANSPLRVHHPKFASSVSRPRMSPAFISFIMGIISPAE